MGTLIQLIHVWTPSGVYGVVLTLRPSRLNAARPKKKSCLVTRDRELQDS